MTRTLGWAAFAAISSIALACSHGPKPPPGPEGSAVTLDAALGNKFVKAGASGTMIARIGLSARKRSATQRPPVNLVLLVDTSGSMEGRAITDARAASLALLGSLAPDDRIAVVTFDSQAQILLPSTKLEDTSAKELRKTIEGMKATGTTDMASGLTLAINQAKQHLIAEGVNRVVLVGDGVPNDDRQINALVADATAHGVSITALGLGNDYDETLMGRIAQQSGGRFFYVEDSTKVASFFAEEVTRLHQVVARHAVLELHPGPGVAVSGVVGRPFSGAADRGVVIPLGDMSLGEENEVVVELASSVAKDGSTVEVLDAVLHYEDGIGGAKHEERIFVGAKSTKDESAIAQGHVKNVEDAFARAKDAAATLERIEQQRNAKKLSDNQNRPMPAPVTAARGGMMPKPSSKSAGTDEPSPSELRSQHDKAIVNFQAH
jgi:Ca-activated chloride channel family protein